MFVHVDGYDWMSEWMNDLMSELFFNIVMDG